MRVRDLFTDDEAVSPVIGVILMVAITVILAAVIGAFVLGFGGGGPSAPSAQWDGSNTSDEVEFEHSGGDSIDDPVSVLDITGNATDGNFTAEPEEDLSTGGTVTIDIDGDPSGEYLLVWENEGSSQDLATYDA